MTSGIVVDHKESGVRYAISEVNFNSKVHTKVRDLKPGETVLGFRPRAKESLGDRGSSSGAPTTPGDAPDDLATASTTPAPTPKATNQTDGPKPGSPDIK